MRFHRKSLALSALMTGMLLQSVACYAQQNGAGGASGNTLGGFVGFTDRYDTDFTFGAHLEHAVDGPWSVGGLVEYTPDAYGNDAATLVMGSVYLRPDFSNRLKIIGGAGVEFKDFGGDDVKFRAGASYDLFLEDRYTLAPTVSFNLGEGKDSVTFGASLNYQF